MTTIHIEVEEDEDRTGAFNAVIAGSLEPLVRRSRQPLLDSARELLARSLAEPHDTIVMLRGGVASMWGVVGGLAKWTVDDPLHGKTPPRFVKYRAFPNKLPVVGE